MVPYLLMAFITALTGFVVASPALVYLTSDLSGQRSGVRRYATYDPELHLFGIELTPGFAQFLAFGVTPCLIVLSVSLFLRGLMHGRRKSHRDLSNELR